VYAALNFLDRFLSKRSCDTLNFQLASVGALFLAAKVEEPKPIPAAEICELTRNNFVPADLHRIELDMLQTLEWHLYPATPFAFASLLILLHGGGDVADAIEERTMAALERTLYDVDFFKYSASMVAVATITCVMNQLDVPSAEIARWLALVDECCLGYVDRANAAHDIEECARAMFSRCRSLAREQCDRVHRPTNICTRLSSFSPKTMRFATPDGARKSDVSDAPPAPLRLNNLKQHRLCGAQENDDAHEAASSSSDGLALDCSPSDLADVDALLITAVLRFDKSAAASAEKKTARSPLKARPPPPQAEQQQQQQRPTNPE